MATSIDYSNLTPQQVADHYRQYVGSGQYNEPEFVNIAKGLGIPESSLTSARQLLLTPPPTTGTQTGVTTEPIDPSQSTLSPNFADYVYRMLAKAEQAANLPYQPYTDTMVAEPTTLQKSAATSLQKLQNPAAFKKAQDLLTKAGNAAGNLSYTPTVFDTGLGPVKSVEEYMSPYTGGVTDILAREARREADIARTTEQARMAQAGAYGGSRQAIMEAERQRNLGTQIEDIRTKGLQAAYDRALKQRLDEANLGLEAQKGTEGSKQFGAEYGLKGLDLQRLAGSGLASLGTAQGTLALGAAKAQADVGAQLRAIEQAKADAAYKQHQESVAYPYQQAKFMQSMLGGLPLTAAPYNSGSSDIASILQGMIAGAGLSSSIYGTPK